MNQSDLPPAIPPINYGPISYAQPYAGRPGIITAIGVLSIVFASLGILTSGILTLWVGGLGLMAMSMRASMNPGGTTMAATAGAPATQPATQPSAALTPAEVQTIIAGVQAKLTGGTLSVQQLAAFTSEIGLPGQRLADPGMALPLNQQVVSADIMPDGSAQIWFYNGNWVDITAAGQATAHVTAAPWAAAAAMFNLNMGALALTLLGTGTSFILAIHLLIAGIMTLRQSPVARLLHWIYVGLKAGASTCTATGATWLVHNFIQTVASAGTTPPPAVAEAIPYAIFIFGVGMAYPVALVILLSTRSAREYYRAGAAGQ